MTSISFQGDDLHLKMCKKIAQLTKIVYNMNSKSEEHDQIIEILKVEHERNINKIMTESHQEILKFKQQCTENECYKKEIKHMSVLLNELEDENKRLQDLLDEYAENSALNEKNLRSDYDNKLLDLQNKLLERQREYEELVESFQSFKNDLIYLKESRITKLTVQQHDELELVKCKYQNELQQAEEKKDEFQKEIKEWESKHEALKAQFIVDKMEIQKECDLKTTKLKGFYEKEIEATNLHQHSGIEEKFLMQKNRLKDDFELKKKELINRIRHLEKSCSEFESKIDDSQMKYTDLNLKYEILQKDFKTRETTLGEKEGMIETVNSLLTNSNSNVKVVEERLKNVISQKEEESNRLHSLLKEKAIASDVFNEENDILKTQINRVEKEMAILQRKYLKEKEANAQSSQSVQTERKATRHFEEQASKLQQEIIELKAKLVTQRQTLVKSHEQVLNAEQQKHAENIKTFKVESQNILKESQDLLLAEFRKNQQKLVAEHSEEIYSLEEKHNTLKSSLDEKFLEIELLQKQIHQYEDKLRISSADVETLEKKIITLQDQLNRSKSKSDNYENLLTELKTGYSDDKEKYIMEQRNLEKKYQVELEETKICVLNDYEKKLENLTRLHDERERKLTNEKKETIERITFEFRHERETLWTNKEKEIDLLKTEIGELKGRLEIIKSNSSTELTQHAQQINDLKEKLEGEKKKLEEMYETRIISLTGEFDRRLEDEQHQWRLETKCELDLVLKTHETALQENENGHVAAVNALKSHMTLEKNKELEIINKEFSQQKETLREILRTENEERLKTASKEHHQQIQTLNHEFEREKELRLKEFSVHTTKIAELAKTLDEEKQQKSTLREKLNTKERESNATTKELQSKVEEILQIRRECNSRIRCHEDELNAAYAKERESLQMRHLKDLQDNMTLWNDKENQLKNDISALTIRLSEAEDRFNERPSRDEDVELICNLQDKIMQQELLCHKLNEERKHYRLELVNREENFNKVFKSNPNVGFMNPIEISRRKSSKKR